MNNLNHHPVYSCASNWKHCCACYLLELFTDNKYVWILILMRSLFPLHKTQQVQDLYKV